MKKILKFIVSSLFLASFFVVGCAQNPSGSGSGLLPSSEGNNPFDMLLSHHNGIRFKVPTIVFKDDYGSDSFLYFHLSREEDGNLLEDHTLDIHDDFEVYFPDLNNSYTPRSMTSYFDYSYKETMANEGFLYLTLNKIEARKGDYKTIITAKDSRDTYTSMLYVPALFNKVIVLKYKVEVTSDNVYLWTDFVFCDDSDEFDLEKMPIYSIKSDDSYSIDGLKSTIECDFDFNNFYISSYMDSRGYDCEKYFTTNDDYYYPQEKSNIKSVTYEGDTLIINANGKYWERVPSYEDEKREIDCNVTCKLKLVDISSGDNNKFELIWKIKDFYYEQVFSREEFNIETGIMEEVTETSGNKVYVDSLINRTFTQTINMR